MTTIDTSQHSFIFLICQVGSEARCKAELAVNHPDLTFAFGRPGLLTFKIGENSAIHSELVLKSSFARTYGYSTGTYKQESCEDLVRELCDSLNARLVHYWSRADQDQQLKEAESEPNPGSKRLNLPAVQLNRNAKSDETVVDVIEIDPGHWLLGFHQAKQTFQRWRAGKPLIRCDEPVVSRAYFKTEEALQWSRIPIRAGDTCVEIGAAPGGSAQALLQRGCHVIAVDPAEMDERLAGYPRLIHIRKRGREVPKKEFSRARWLLADLNVAPRFTLDTVEDIVTNENVHVRGLILTLKLMDETGAATPHCLSVDEMTELVARVRGWGMRFIKTRQLAYNRNEVCLFALKQKALMRARKRR